METIAILPPPPQSTGDPLQFLWPDSEEEAVVRVTQIRVPDKGSRPQTARVVIEGVPVDGVVDTGADITIVGAEAFKRIATVAKLRRRDFKPADKTPHTYDQRTFHIDGRVDLDITFEGQTMKTPIYVKMDAREQLLLSEGVCRQLGIVAYHSRVVPGHGEDKKAVAAEMYVPMVRVQLIQAVKMKPGESVIAKVKLVGGGVGGTGYNSIEGTDMVAGAPKQVMLIESDRELPEKIGAQVSGTLVEVQTDGCARVMLTNKHSLTHKIEEGTDVSQAVPVDIVEAEEMELETDREEMFSASGWSFSGTISKRGASCTRT